MAKGAAEEAAPHNFKLRIKLVMRCTALQVAGDECGCSLVTLSDEFVEVFILRRAHGAQAEIVDRDHLDPGKLLKFPFVGVGGACRMELSQQLVVGDEEDIVAGAQRTMGKGLDQMRFAGADGSGNQHGGVFGNEAAGREFSDQCVVHGGAESVVETLQRLVARHLRFAQTLAELTLISACHFVLDQERQEIGIGELGFDRLLVSRRKRIQDAGQAELLEHRFELRHGVHVVLQGGTLRWVLRGCRC
jgi:hypothetical protein